MMIHDIQIEDLKVDFIILGTQIADTLVKVKKGNLIILDIYIKDMKDNVIVIILDTYQRHEGYCDSDNFDTQIADTLVQHMQVNVIITDT